MSKLGSLVRERILILDGAMGTMIQQYNLTEEDFSFVSGSMLFPKMIPIRESEIFKLEFASN